VARGKNFDSAAPAIPARNGRLRMRWPQQSGKGWPWLNWPKRHAKEKTQRARPAGL